MRKKRWQDLTASQRRLVALGSAMQFALLAAALIDIWRRPEDEIRGPKRLWVGLSFVNFAGPVSYFVFGRKTRAQDKARHSAG